MYRSLSSENMYILAIISQIKLQTMSLKKKERNSLDNQNIYQNKQKLNNRIDAKDR